MPQVYADKIGSYRRQGHIVAGKVWGGKPMRLSKKEQLRIKELLAEIETILQWWPREYNHELKGSNLYIEPCTDRSGNAWYKFTTYDSAKVVREGNES